MFPIMDYYFSVFCTLIYYIMLFIDVKIIDPPKSIRILATEKFPGGRLPCSRVVFDKGEIRVR